MIAAPVFLYDYEDVPRNICTVAIRLDMSIVLWLKSWSLKLEWFMIGFWTQMRDVVMWEKKKSHFEQNEDCDWANELNKGNWSLVRNGCGWADLLVVDCGLILN